MNGATLADAAPTLESTLTAALRRHGAYRVAQVLGVSRLAVMAVALGLECKETTRFTIGARRDRLAVLDEETGR